MTGKHGSRLGFAESCNSLSLPLALLAAVVDTFLQTTLVGMLFAVEASRFGGETAQRHHIAEGVQHRVRQ